MLKYIGHFKIGLLILLVLIIEYYALRISYFTLCDFRVVIWIALLLNLSLPLLYFYSREPKLSIFIFWFIFIVIVPYQVILGYKLLKIRLEMIDVVNYINQHKIQKGQYPLDLKNYKFSDNELQNNINYQFEESEFSLEYFVTDCECVSKYSSKEHLLDKKFKKYNFD